MKNEGWRMRKFRMYYTSLCDEAQNFIVVVEDNWGNMTEMEFDFNDAGDGNDLPKAGFHSKILGKRIQLYDRRISYGTEYSLARSIG